LLGIRSDYKKNELGLLRMLGLSGNMMYLIISIQAIGLSLLGFMVGAALGIGLIALLGERTIEGVSVSHFKHSWPWLAIGLTSSVVITVIGAVLGGMPAASKSPASLVNS
jgi:ABC-type antimicrobial peptide transport system permease subunit